ncbi:hypothetical protein D3C87_1978680 [compost metagenome]
MPVQFWLAGIYITISACLFQFIGTDYGDGNVIIEFTTFRNYITIRINDHGAAVLKLIVIHSYGIRENDIDGIVISSCRKPFH